MEKDKLLKGTVGLLLLLVILTIPSFWHMLRPGIFSMQDFHAFRLFEFDRCIQDLQIPCRWAPDSSFGYGQPLFNFYNQIVYALGEPFLLAGLQVIDTIKLLFILSLVGSAIGMFFLGRQLWKSNLAGFLAAALYVYAPYRAVDVFVRGALPEAFAFVFFPLIVLFFNRYVLGERKNNLLLFSLLLALLLLTHNLSFLMFSIFLVFWATYFLTVHKKRFLVKSLILGLLLTLSISSFYLLPVLFENRLTTLGETTAGYYIFQIHFASLYQLLISRTWGYGGSEWGMDDLLSFSVGHVQWVLPLFLLGWVFVTRKIRESLYLLVIVALGWFALFLTHGRSVLLWESLPPLAFVQFPWRFLSIATFAFALAGGSIFLFLKDFKLKVSVFGLVIALTIFLNVGFFREDIWLETTDNEQFTGEIWEWHTSSARADFWPKYAEKVPEGPAPANPIILNGQGEITSFNETSKSMVANLVVVSDQATVQFPGVYFDGWRGFKDGEEIGVYPEGKYGQMTTELSKGKHSVSLEFTNTPVRTIGNFISLASLIVLFWLLFKKRIFTKKA